MSTLLWALYQAATGLALLLAGPVLLVRRGAHYLPTLPGRLGGAGTGEGTGAAGEGAGAGGPVQGALWIHAVSMGEAAVAATLAQGLPADLPLLVTTVTPTGQERASALLGGRAAVAYLPFELGFAVGRFYRRYAPGALVLVEGDLWPLVLREARRRGLPVAVVNGRVSDRSFRRMRRLLPLFGPRLGPLLSSVDRFGVQTARDREKLLVLGVAPERVVVTGNLKYDSPDPQRRPELEAAVEGLAGGRAVIVAGSTMAGEEEQVLAALSRLGGGPAGSRTAESAGYQPGSGGRALLVLAPRHPERWDEVERLIAARGLSYLRRSQLEKVGEARPAVLLLDSLGELAGLYALAAAAFVGGTLVPTGGHNPLEPARFGVPVAVGPSMENFREMAARFDRAEAWRRVDGAEELAAAWEGWLDDPAAARETGERGARLVEENRGALERTLELLGPVLARVAEGAGA